MMRFGERVLVVAPYCPAGRSGIVALGAAAKIDSVLGMFLSSGRKVILLNSGHQEAQASEARVRRMRLGGKCLVEFSPPTKRSRVRGKALNLLWLPRCVWRLHKDKAIATIWLYNPYAFEVLFLLLMKWVRRDIRFFLELEDLPSARSRLGLGAVKNLIDRAGLFFCRRYLTGCVYIQPSMASLFSECITAIRYTPTIIPGAIMDRALSGLGRRIGDAPIWGYFGGLSVEKGADQVRSLIEARTTRGGWIVCGNGPLQDDFARLASQDGRALSFCGTVSPSEFLSIYRCADIIVNFHKPLGEFGNGVFPCKALEAIAHGKILVSTPMTGCPPEIEKAIWWLENTEEGNLRRIVNQVEKSAADDGGNRKDALLWLKATCSTESLMEWIEQFSLDSTSVI